MKLSAKWQLDAALLSRPVDLTALVSLSQSDAAAFLEDNTLHRLITILLNEKNLSKADKDTKLDVLCILGNVAMGGKICLQEVRSSLGGISEWFDEYMSKEESESSQEPELHKAMTLLLARCWNYELKTEDVLELTQGNRRIALCTVVGLLEDGETYATALKQRQKPGQGKMGQWEHELVIKRYEKPLLLQICRLLRGFTHPGTYFQFSGSGEEITLYSVEVFSNELDSLLEITIRSRFVEKLSIALYDVLCLEEKEGGKSRALEESDHLAVACVHAFLQNLYFYASRNVEEFRLHMLLDTLLIPRLMIPYLEKCVTHALILNSQVELAQQIESDAAVAQLILHSPQLVQGISSTLRTLIIASFRAPNTLFVMILLRQLNPTYHLLTRAQHFCRAHEYIFTLLCLLNVNMGTLDLSGGGAASVSDDSYADESLAGSGGVDGAVLLKELEAVFLSMDVEKQGRIVKRVMSSGALPVARDTPSYVAIMSVLLGGNVGQLQYSTKHSLMASTKRGLNDDDDEEDSYARIRAEAKKESEERLNSLRTHDSDLPSTDTVPVSESNNPAVVREMSSNVSQHQNDLTDEMIAQGKTSYEIALAVTKSIELHRQEMKSLGSSYPKQPKPSNGSGGSSSEVAPDKDKEKYRLLGELPSLITPASRDRMQQDVRYTMKLELPSSSSMGKKATESSESKAESTDANQIPKEFLCPINGHVMKNPVATPGGLVYERETIELWIDTRGQLCPLTLQPLKKSDLVPADELRNKIKRYHIQQTALRSVPKIIAASMASNSNSSQQDYDLYDF